MRHMHRLNRVNPEKQPKKRAARTHFNPCTKECDKFKFAIIKFNTKHRTRDAASCLVEVAHTPLKAPSPRRTNGKTRSAVYGFSCHSSGRREASASGPNVNNTNGSCYSLPGVRMVPTTVWIACGRAHYSAGVSWGPAPLPPPKSPSRYAACATMPVCLRVSFLI